MSTLRFAFAAPDRATADEIERTLASRGIAARRIGRAEAVRFGMKIGSVEGTPEELVAVAEAGPELVDALFDTLERFRTRARALVGGEPVPVPSRLALLALLSREPLVKPPGFKSFERK